MKNIKKLILRFGTRIMAFNMRTIGIVIFSLSPIFLGFHCEEQHNSGMWYVRNCTDQTLTLSFPPDHYWKDRSVAPGNVVLIQEYRYRISKPYFDHLPETMASHSSGKASLDVLSKNGDLLKRWRYLDKDLPGKNFFKEFGWHHDEHRAGEIAAAWIFDIMPEDIIKKDD